MAKVEKRFEKYKPLQKKNLRFFKLVVHRQKQGDFWRFHPHVFEEGSYFVDTTDWESLLPVPTSG